MNKTVKVVLAIVTVLAVAAGYFLYKDMYEETLVCTSEHEGYEVRIYMVGSPDFPFGNTSCRIKLIRTTVSSGKRTSCCSMTARQPRRKTSRSAGRKTRLS